MVVAHFRYISLDYGPGVELFRAGQSSHGEAFGLYGVTEFRAELFGLDCRGVDDEFIASHVTGWFELRVNKG